MILSSVPLQWHLLAPTREQADAFIRNFVASRLPTLDANDMLYQFDASRNYDPSASLGRSLRRCWPSTPPTTGSTHPSSASWRP